MHTPEPWRFERIGASSTVRAPDGSIIARTFCCTKTGHQSYNEQFAEADANAILMAAAPQLLQALENADKLITQLMPGIKSIVLQDFGFLNDTLMQITATIHRAKGEI